MIILGFLPLYSLAKSEASAPNSFAVSNKAKSHTEKPAELVDITADQFSQLEASALDAIDNPPSCNGSSRDDRILKPIRNAMANTPSLKNKGNSCEDIKGVIDAITNYAKANETTTASNGATSQYGIYDKGGNLRYVLHIVGSKSGMPGEIKSILGSGKDNFQVHQFPGVVRPAGSQ